MTKFRKLVGSHNELQIIHDTEYEEFIISLRHLPDEGFTICESTSKALAEFILERLKEK